MDEVLISININGQPVTARSGKTILEVARENGIDIPVQGNRSKWRARTS